MNSIATASMFQSQNLHRVRRDEVAQPALNKPDSYPILWSAELNRLRFASAWKQTLVRNFSTFDLVTNSPTKAD